MLSGSVRLFRIGGIDVGVHASWLIIFALVAWSLATGLFPFLVPGLTPLEAWVLGIVASLLLFASVLVHELAHSFTARARGLDARSITLFLFGGVSNLAGEAKKPSTEFLVAVVGPLTSLAIAGLSGVVAALLAGVDVRAQVVAGYLAFINLALAIFNLLPGFPLDGGRLLRAVVWNATGSLRRATEVATFVGRMVAYLIIGWGLFALFNGNILGGVWIAAIGWFLHNAASTSLQQVVVEQRLKAVRVGDVLRADPSSVPPAISVAELIEDHLLPGNRRAMPVMDDGRLIGLVTLGDIQQVPREQRGEVRVGDVMGGREGLVTARPTDTLWDAIQRLGGGDYEQLPVVDDGRLVGMLTRADVMRQIQLREALDVEGASAR